MVRVLKECLCRRCGGGRRYFFSWGQGAYSLPTRKKPKNPLRGGEEVSKSITRKDRQSQQEGETGVLLPGWMPPSEQGTMRRFLGEGDHVPGSDMSSLTDTPFYGHF